MRSRLTSSKLRQLFESTCRAAVAIFDVDHSGFVMREGKRDFGHVIAEYPPTGITGTMLRFGRLALEQRLWESGEPFCISDVNEELPRLGHIGQVLGRMNITSVLIVPVIVDNEVVGSFSLDIFAPNSRCFSKDDVRRCQALAVQLAAALTHASKSIELATIRAMTIRILRSGLSKNELLMEIIGRAKRLLAAKGGGIYELDEDAKRLILVADLHRGTRILGKEVLVGEGMVGRLIRSRKIWSTVKDYSRYQHRVSGFDDQPFGAVLEVKLRWQSKVLGVLYIDDKAGREFTVQDAKLLQLFADHAAMTLGLATRQDRDADMLSRLKQLPLATSALLDDDENKTIDTLCVDAAGHARLILNAETAAIFLSEDRDNIVLVASAGHARNGFTRGLRFSTRLDKPSLTGFAAQYGTVLNLWGEDLAQHPHNGLGSPSHLRNRHCKSFLSIPLIRRSGRRLGLLKVENSLSRIRDGELESRFSKEDESIIELLGLLISSAIEDAERIQQARADTALAIDALEARNPVLISLTHQVHHLLGLVDLTVTDFCDWADRAPNVPARKRNALASLRRQAAEITEITGDFLDLVSAERSAKKTGMDINSAVRSALRLYSVSLNRAMVDSVLRLTPDLPLVNGEPLEMVQILGNLIRNGQRAMTRSKKKRLTVTTSLDEGRTAVVIAVSDTGSGIAAKYKRRLFTRGFTTDLGAGGHGFGLAAAKELVEARYGGALFLSASRVGSGATFVLTLPIASHPSN